MAINGNYATPVIVNGYSCKNCTDVDNAKKHIDPAHPKSGPYGVDAKEDPTQTQPAVVFGGSLGKLNASSIAMVPLGSSGTPTSLTATSQASGSTGARTSGLGAQLDISA